MNYDRIMEISRSIISEQESANQSEEAQPSSDVRIHYNEDMDILDDPEYVNAIKGDSPCAAIKKRADILTPEEFYAMMRMTNTEHEII